MSAAWWRGATIYQIYPRSFLDADGDGIGDLAGITQRLDHVASLGADGVWISPFFTSPMVDFGYDVADYRDIDPIFGTMADFDALIARAHDLGLKVMIDLVFAHTSDKHPWFAESRAGGAGTREDWALKDWYVWADARADGTPPNNWQSVFGGPAWTWDARRGQYYMHQFLKEQPQLNVHNPEVQDALLDVVRFWLGKGVDGFRFDALNHAMHDPALRDNPVNPEPGPRTRPFDFQLRTQSQNHPALVGFIERIRATIDAAGGACSIAEVGGANPMPLMRAYTAGDARLSSAYCFAFLDPGALTPARVAEALAAWTGAPATHGPDKGLPEGWPSWAFENHDVPRSLSRWAPEAHRAAYARMEMLLLGALRGTIFLYQGQELGLAQDDIPFEALRDPEAIANWPQTLGRDGVRTPMPWTPSAAHAGFTTGTPWLPVSPGNAARAVAAQEDDADSLLHFTRRVIALRRAHPTLRTGDLRDVTAEGDLLRFRRIGADGTALFCAFNLGGETIALGATGTILLAANGATPATLPPYGALIAAETHA